MDPLTRVRPPRRHRRGWTLLIAAAISCGLHGWLLFGIKGLPHRAPEDFPTAYVRVTPASPAVRAEADEPAPAGHERPRLPSPVRPVEPMPAPSRLSAPENPVLVPTRFSSVAVTAGDLTEDELAGALRSEGASLAESLAGAFTGQPAGAEGVPGLNGTVYLTSEVDRQPIPILQFAPRVPRALQRDLTFATVKVRFVVTTTGEVVGAHVLASSLPGLEEATLAALAHWKFRPGKKDGVAVNTRVEQEFRFHKEESPFSM